MEKIMFCFLCLKSHSAEKDVEGCKQLRNKIIDNLDAELTEEGYIVHSHTIEFSADDPEIIIEQMIIEPPYKLDYIYIDLKLPQNKEGNNER